MWPEAKHDQFGMRHAWTSYRHPDDYPRIKHHAKKHPQPKRAPQQDPWKMQQRIIAAHTLKCGNRLWLHWRENLQIVCKVRSNRGTITVTLRDAVTGTKRTQQFSASVSISILY